MRKGRPPSRSNLAKLGLRAAGVAHDLAQPLTAALLAARKIEGKGAAPLRDALHRMEDLLQAIRSELHPEKTKEAARRTPMARVRRNLLAVLTPAERRRTRIELSGGLHADATPIERILGNLLANALRHGTGLVKVAGSARDDGLSLTVEGGVGKRRSQSGWGIGLASCQDLASRHGLVLRVEITPQGSRASLEGKP